MQKSKKRSCYNLILGNHIKLKMILFIILMCLSDSTIISQEKLTNHDNIQKVILNEPSYNLGLLSGIAIDDDDNIYILIRAGRDFRTGLKEKINMPVILKYNKEEKLIDSFGSGMFSLPHMITIDNKDNLWVTDILLQQVVKLNSKGKLKYAIGNQYIAGNDSLHFNQPTDVAFSKDNSFYIADGYKNSRIIKYSAKGKFINAWGTKGNKIGEFNLPHSIVLTDDKIYVADRRNSRIQIFDLSLNFISDLNLKEQIGDPLSIAIANNGNIIASGFKATILLSPNLEEIRTWPVSGHDIAVNSKGVIYLVGLDGLIKIESD